MTPLILLVGFLGAGKTTLLRTCLPELTARGITPSVILNDYVNARVDAATLAGLVDDLTPIGGTCVCCGSRGELLGALAGARPGPRRLMMIEANGTVDAGDLIEILVAESALARYTIPIQVSVVDAVRWQSRHWYDSLEADQVRTAGFVVVTRNDLVEAGRRAEVEGAVRELAPAATIIDLPGLCDALTGIVGDLDKHPARRFAAVGGTHPTHDHGHARHHFSALEVPLPPRVDRDRLESWLRALPLEVVRTKGVARLEGGDWVYFARLDDRGSISVRTVSGFDLDPVAILIGSRLTAESAIGVEAVAVVAG